MDEQKRNENLKPQAENRPNETDKKKKKPKLGPNGKKKKKPIGRIIVLTILGIIVIAAVLFVRSCQKSQEQLMTPIEQYVAVEKTDLENTVALSGTVKSNKSHQISAPAQLEVLTLDVAEGDRVTEGQILATLDTTDLEFDIRTAEINIENAKISDSAKKTSTSNSKRQARDTAKSNKADLEIAQEKYQQAKEKMDVMNEGKYEGENALETNDDGALAEADRLASAVVQAKLEFEAAKRSYDDLLKKNGNTSAVVSARLDLETSQRKYDEAIDGTAAKYDLDKAAMSLDTAQQKQYDAKIQGDENVRKAQLALDSANQKLYDAQIQGNDSVNKAQLALDSAYNSSNQTYNNASSSNYQMNQASISVADAQINLQSAITQRDSNLAAAQRGVDEANLALQTAMTGRDSSNVSADRSVEEAQLAHEDAKKAAEDAKVTQKDALDRAQSAYDAAISNSSTEIKSAYDTLRKAEVNYEKALQDQKDGFRDAANALKKAQLSYDAALSNVNAASVQDPDTIELQEIALEKLKKQVGDSVIRSPISGTVTAVNTELGKMASGILFTINDTDDLIVEATVNEFDIGNIAVGQAVRVRTDSLGDEEVKGTVMHVSESAVQSVSMDGTTTGTSNSSKVSFTVKIKLDEHDERVKIGMNAQVTVITERKDGVLAVPIETVTFSDTGATVKVKTDAATGSAEPTSREVPVTTGIETDTMIEISSPEITEGIMVVSGMTSPLQDMMNSGQIPGGVQVQVE